MANVHMTYEIHFRWWLKIYLWMVETTYGFIVNYVDIEAEPNQEKIDYWIARGTYLKGVRDE